MIPLYQSVAITAPKSIWLKQILDPLAMACRLPKIPLEIRPLDCAGLCSPGQPDGRVFVSSRIVFWRQSAIVNIYLHEVAHRLLDNAPKHVQDHGAEFFALLLTLQIRAQLHLKSLGNSSSPIAQLSFYDCIDESPVWRQHNIIADDWFTVQIAWSLKTADQLAKSNLDASEIASMLPKLWVDEVKNYRSLIDSQLMAEKDQVKELERLRELVGSYKTGLVAVSFFLFLTWGAIFTHAK